MENNIVCGCFNVSEQDIKNAINDGVKTFKELQDKTNIGTDCPPCTIDSEVIFNRILKETTN